MFAVKTQIERSKRALEFKKRHERTDEEVTFVEL